MEICFTDPCCWAVLSRSGIQCKVYEGPENKRGVFGNSVLFVMSPTCTLPYEVLFELANDTSYPATVQVLRPEDGSRVGPTILLHSDESIALVLTAGRAYKYAVRQHGKEANLS